MPRSGIACARQFRKGRVNIVEQISRIAFRRSGTNLVCDRLNGAFGMKRCGGIASARDTPSTADSTEKRVMTCGLPSSKSRKLSLTKLPTACPCASRKTTLTGTRFTLTLSVGSPRRSESAGALFVAGCCSACIFSCSLRRADSLARAEAVAASAICCCICSCSAFSRAVFS